SGEGGLGRPAAVRGNSGPSVSRSEFPMKSRSKGLPALVLTALALVAPSWSPAQTRQSQIATEGGNFPLYVTVEYLGMAGGKTVGWGRPPAPGASMGPAQEERR